MLELIFILICAYLLTGISLYVYSVFKTWEITSYWSFRISDGHIGIVEYPSWLMFWLEWIYSKVKR